MTKVIRKYLGVLAALPFLLAPTISGAFEIPGYNGFAVGIGLTGAAVQVVGQETDPEGTKGANIRDDVALEKASIFGEVRFNVVDRLGLTVGLSMIPGTARFVSESKPDTDLTTVDDGTNAGTSKVTGDISEVRSIYIQPTIRITDVFTVYATAGITTMNVKGDASLVTSTNFNKTVTVDGTRFGAGVMAEVANGFFVKLEGAIQDYDEFSFTTSDSTVARVNIEEENVTLLLGKAF
jgi:opacity protein-like surface antigen